MNEQILSAVRKLPRHRLEDVTLRMMEELRLSRRGLAPRAYFNAVLCGFILGTVVATAGFVLGAMIR